MPSLDTNVLARWIVRDVPEQVAKVDRLLEEPAMQYNVSLHCLVELEHLLRAHYEFPRHLIVGHFERILSHGRLRVDAKLLRQILPLYATHSLLSFVDCCLAVIAQHEDTEPLLTFDKKLANQLPQARLLQ